MSKSKAAAPAPESTPGAAEARAPQPSLFTTVERLAALQLGNRYLWLVFGIGLYLLLQLSWWAAKYPTRFDTLELMGHITGVLHATLLASALVLALGTPGTRETWRKRRPGQPFNFVACGLSAPLVLTPVYLLLILPLMFLYRFPELLAQAKINIPVMLLQRGLLLLCFTVLMYNLVLALRYNLRWNWTLCGLLGLAAHLWLAGYLTWLSYTTEFFRRLNDLFYFNQLWRYFPSFPNWQRPEVFHNMQELFLPYFASIVLLCGLTALLWLPRAGQLTDAEARA